MDPAELERFAERLRREERKIKEQIDSYQLEQAASLKDSIHELSSYDNHPADIANETFERSKDLALLDNARALHQQVREALERIGNGSFGRCRRCGQEIERERLEALPSAALCLNCRKIEESFDPPRWRPIEEEVLEPSFERGSMDPAHTAGLDGEDIWQDLARHGTSNTPSDSAGLDFYEDAFTDRDDRRGLVEEVDGIIDVGPDEIPPAPREADNVSI